MPLNKNQLNRYHRNILLPTLGPCGQEKLLASKVLLVGAGGLGAPAALYLTAAGVGSIGVIDHDRVDLSNLQRQVLYKTSDIGRSKADAARDALQALNPDVCITPYPERLTSSNAIARIKGYDFVIDCTDNFATKFLIADACHFSKTPYSHAGISAFTGQLMTVLPGVTTCFRCVFTEPPPTDLVPPPSTQGVMGVLPGVIGSLQATETIKFLTNQGDLLTDSLLTYDALSMTFRRMNVVRNEACALCCEKPTILEP